MTATGRHYRVLASHSLSIYRFDTRYRYIEMTPPRPAPSPTRLLSRGDLRLLALALLGEQPRHGYELMQHVSELFARAYTPSAGTMYPLLASFEQAGWVLGEDDAGRRRFHITDTGRAELLARRDEVKAAQHRAWHRARDIAKADMPPALRDALRQFKVALVRHHGRWVDGEAEQVADYLLRATALLNGQPVTPPDSSTPPA